MAVLDQRGSGYICVPWEIESHCYSAYYESIFAIQKTVVVSNGKGTVVKVLICIAIPRSAIKGIVMEMVIPE